MDEVHFQPREKQIFRYHNGKEVVAQDPLVLRGQLRIAAIQQGTSIDKLIDAANAVDLADATDIQIADGWQAAFMLSDVARGVFQLDESADMAHALGVIDSFHTFLEKKNPPAASPATSTPPTASISATPPITDTSLASS